ncbi:MAG TPA: class I SAM-dependent methyltransferase [Chitinophagaceae bacterium]|nr:class I SAM-dependent methyltransferase [Chitinophagaceae bacterium]
MAASGEWFRDWFNTSYYHQLYFNRDETEAAAFIHRLLNYLKPDPDALLIDVACGRGRHAKMLAQHGYSVTGIDLSAENISVAKAFETEKLQFFQHDMRLPFWINFFDYAFNFFTSFGYFRTEREHYNAVRTIAQSLHPGGTLMMDYLNVHYAEDHLVHKSEKEIDGVNFFLTKWYDESYFYKKILVEDERLEAPLEFTEKVAKFSLGDFNDMFAFHDLQLQEVFGNYQLGSYDVKKSPRLIMIARKLRH